MATRIPPITYCCGSRPVHGPTRKPQVIAPPQTGVYNEFLREVNFAVDQIQNLSRTPRQALDAATARSQTAVDRDLRINARRERL